MSSNKWRRSLSIISGLKLPKTKKSFLSRSIDYVLCKKEPAIDEVVVDVEETKPEGEQRESWGGQFSFFLAALGYTIGLSCVWRFPILAYTDGGGAFLVPFIIMSLLLGIPLVFLELSVGQYTSLGTLSCWTMAKAFRGVGIAMNFSNAYVCIYYNMIIAYSFYYLFLSFNATLPWKFCNTAWASPNCVDNFDPSVFTFNACTDPSLYQCANGFCLNATSYNNSITSSSMTMNSSSYSLDIECNVVNSTYQVGLWDPIFPAQDYWLKVVLQKSDSIENSGGFVWQLVVALAVAWLVTFFMVVKGVEGTGMVVYFTTTFPYVVLLILGVKGWTLEGASQGISYYITPDLAKLSDINVWSDAAVQVFFTLSISYGGLLTYASFNKFDAPILRDSIILSVASCLTSVFCGFVVFPYIGYLSHVTGLPIDQVIQSDNGLAFIVFPYAVSTMAGSPFWSALFFFMVLTIGLDNMMASVETSITALCDVMPFLKKTNFRKFLVACSVVGVFFTIGLLFCLRSGIYWVDLFNTYSGTWGVLITATVECLSVAFFYGFDNYRSDIFVMIGHRAAYSKWFNFYRISWLLICPAILFFMIIYGWVTFARTSDGNYTFPIWADILGNIMNLFIVLGMLLYFLYYVYDVIKHKKSWKSLFEPGPSWIPMRLPDRVFANVVKFEEKYVKYNPDDELQNEEAKIRRRKSKRGSIMPAEIFRVKVPMISDQIDRSMTAWKSADDEQIPPASDSFYRGDSTMSMSDETESSVTSF